VGIAEKIQSEVKGQGHSEVRKNLPVTRISVLSKGISMEVAKILIM